MNQKIIVFMLVMFFAVSVQASEAIKLCVSCHGSTTSSNNEFPNLAGQNAEYIANQIKSFQSGERKDITMNSVASLVDDKLLAEISAYYAKQKPDSNGFDAELAAKGKDTFTSVCVACHGAKGLGSDQFARLATQKSAYLSNQLKAFRSGERKNSLMSEVASKLSDDEIAAVAEYLSSL